MGAVLIILRLATIYVQAIKDEGPTYQANDGHGTDMIRTSKFYGGI